MLGTLAIFNSSLDSGGLLDGIRSSPQKAAWIGLGVLSGLLFILFCLGILYSWRKWRDAAGATGPGSLSASSLEMLWQRFLKNLPRNARPLVTRYPSVVVLGPVGSGKSQVIRSFVDWQGQTSQFLPSLLDSPLVQIYLGSKLLVEELSAQLLANTSALAGQALRRLWAPITREQAPMALLVLKLPMLESATPEQREELAQKMRGKLATLGRLAGVPIEARLCMTHLDQVRGFAQTARFCAAHHIPLVLNLQGAGSGEEKKSPELMRYLPLALTKLPAADFRELVLFLKELPRLFAALDGFIKPLREWSVASVSPAVERLYLYSNIDGASGSNPFAGRRIQPVSSLIARIKAWLPPSLRGAQWHLLVSISAVLLTAALCVYAAARQNRAIYRADTAVSEFEQAVHRAEATLGDVRESAAVRTASHAAREAIEQINDSEEAWVLHRIVYRGAKAGLSRRMLEILRRAYFLPLLARYGAQRDVERTLYTLAVTYAARDTALGALVSSELRDIAQALGISDVIIQDYIQMSRVPWSGAAAVPWNRLVSGEAPATANPETWLRYFSELQQVYRRQGVNAEQLRRLQREALLLMRVADAVRTRRKLAQILNAIAEESPLVEIEQRLGSRHPELAPPQWLRDQQVAISGVLHMVHDTDQQAVRAGQMSLAQVLRLLTDLDERKRNEDQIYAFEINEQSFSFSGRVWSDMLLRGRNQLVLGALYKASDLPVESTSRNSTGSRHHRHGSEKAAASEFEPHKTSHRHRHRHRKGSHLASSDDENSPGPAAANAHRPSPHHQSTERLESPPSGNEDAKLTNAEARQYSRASYEQDMKILLQKLDKALGDDSGLPAAQRQYLTNYVQGEARRYASRYCAALLQQYKSYVFPGGGFDSTRAALLDLLTPNGSLLSHLKAIAENANLSGLDGRFTAPLASCLAQLKPLVTLMTPGQDGGYPGLKPYSEIVAAVLKELDNAKPAEVREDGKPVGLHELLSPIGRLGLAARMEQEGSPERKVMQVMESAGLGGPMAGPFIQPIRQLERLGINDLEQTLSQQWESAVLPLLGSILARYPFDRHAERELQPGELDVIKPVAGSFWQSFRQIFGPVCMEQGGTFSARKWSHGSVALPKRMLPLVNQVAALSNALFTRDGVRRPLELFVKALPVSVCYPQRPAAASFLKVGKAQILGVNTRPAIIAFSVPWWQQDIASVGLEFAGSGQQRSAQSIEIADSLWNFFRLLERASAFGNVQTWALPKEGESGTCEVRFEIEPNPISPFRFR